MNIPQIVIEFIRELPRYHEDVVKLLLRDDWFDHTNASQWFEELFRHETGAKFFIEKIFASGITPIEAVKRFRRFYPLMTKAGLKPKTIETLIIYLGRYGTEGYDNFIDELRTLVRLDTFSELVSYADPKLSTGLEKFLDWYRAQEPHMSQIFSEALSMPGAVRDDFWILSADRTEYKFNEQGFTFRRDQYARNRLNFIRQNLKVASVAQNPESAPKGVALSCAERLSKLEQ